jgi:hypothetical protein
MDYQFIQACLHHQRRGRGADLPCGGQVLGEESPIAPKMGGSLFLHSSFPAHSCV